MTMNGIMRWWRAMLVVVALLGGGWAAGLSSASAAAESPVSTRVDPSCATVTFADSDWFPAYVLRRGVGLVGWRTSAHPYVRDRCSHGALSVSGTIDRSNLVRKGGNIVVQGVDYRTSSRTTWTALRTACSTVSTPNGLGYCWRDPGHLDLAPSTRVAQVRIRTYLVFGGSVYAPRTYTCTMATRSCN
jgi:hypothetical protein